MTLDSGWRYGIAQHGDASLRAHSCLLLDFPAFLFTTYAIPTGERARHLMLRRSLQLYRHGPLMDQKHVSNQYIDNDHHCFLEIAVNAQKPQGERTWHRKCVDECKGCSCSHASECIRLAFCSPFRWYSPSSANSCMRSRTRSVHESYVIAAAVAAWLHNSALLPHGGAS